jgi:hypothetical protein
MDADTVWDQMLEQASYRQLKSLLKAQTNIRHSAERMAREAREAMEALAVSFAWDEVNRYSLASPAGLDVLDIQELAEMTREALRKQTDALEEQTRYAERKAAELEEENERFRAEMEWVKKNWPEQEKAGEASGVWHTPPKPKTRTNDNIHS